MDLERLALAAPRDPIAAQAVARYLQGYFHDCLCRWLGGADDDVVQESITALHRKLGAFEDRGPGSFLAWARGFLRTQVKANSRSLGRQARVREALAGRICTPATTMTSLIDRGELFEILDGELDSLVPAHQRAIQNELAGGDARRLADIERISLNAARVLQSRAHKKLRHFVDQRMNGTAARPAAGRSRSKRRTRRSRSSSRSPQASL